MKIVCYGDSNTYGWDPRCFSGNRYPDPWPELAGRITGHEFINCGEPGRIVPCRKEQLEWFRRDVKANDPEILMIMLGTNDLFYTTEHTAGDVAQRMGKMISFAIDNNLAEKILLLSCPHVTLQDEPYMTVLEGISEEYRMLAQKEKIWFADPLHWDIPLAYDGVHFTQEGHRIFAEKINREIEGFLHVLL